MDNAQGMNAKPSIAYVIDPRFSGGTSAAIASELRVVAQFARITIHAVSSNMFKGRNAAPALLRAVKEIGADLIWDAPSIGADIVIVHNPSFLKFDSTFHTSIVAKHLIVVTHENFLRPGKKESFDVLQCLSMIDQSSLALRKSIAPISTYNRTTIKDWIELNPQEFNWSILDQDCFNICDFAFQKPTENPTDRRGRHSRPGMEKFPSLSDMDSCFPDHAKTNVILGGDLFIRENIRRPHWNIHPFNGLELPEYFDQFDFMVYFTARTWHESFGRVLAESIAAGKVVITDPSTASVFGTAVVSAAPSGVDEIISHFVSHPEKYKKHVISAQKKLSGFSSTAFEHRFLSMLENNLGLSS